MSEFFNGLVTTETLNQARRAGLEGGWYIVPKSFRISDTAGAFATSRTLQSLNTSWYTAQFDAISIEKLGSNKIMYTVNIPGDASSIVRKIAEIAFVAQTPSGTEFLYVLIQPTSDITFTPGVSLKTAFTIALNNTTVKDTYTIQFTDPEDIQAHNIDELSHQNLFSRYALKTQIPTDIQAHNINGQAHQNLFSLYALKTQIPVISYEG